MKYEDINRRYTEIIAEYLANDYIINTITMGGSQGENAKVDLTNGKEILRIFVEDFSRYDENRYAVTGVKITVGRVTADVTPNSSLRETIWNNDLQLISSEEFYVVGEDRCHGKFYGTYKDAVSAHDLRVKRHIAREKNVQSFPSPKAMEIAKQCVRRIFTVKTVRESDVAIFKNRKGDYIIAYKDTTYRLR